MTGRIAAPTAVAVGLLVPAAAAADPVLAPLEPCYVVATQDDRQPVTVSGTGFTPDGLVAIDVGGEAAQTRAGADGTLPGGSLGAPYVKGADRRFTVTATDLESGAQATRTALVTRLRVTIRPRPRLARRRVRFAGSGFTADRPVHAHYVRDGVERHRVRLARRPSGACGAFSARKRLFGFAPRDGRWTIQFDQQRRYERRPGTVFVRLPVTVSED